MVPSAQRLEQNELSLDQIQVQQVPLPEIPPIIPHDELDFALTGRAVVAYELFQLVQGPQLDELTWETVYHYSCGRLYPNVEIEPFLMAGEAYVAIVKAQLQKLHPIPLQLSSPLATWYYMLKDCHPWSQELQDLIAFLSGQGDSLANLHMVEAYYYCLCHGQDVSSFEERLELPDFV